MIDGGAASSGDADLPSMRLPWVESPLFARELERRAGSLTGDQRELASAFHEQGYLVLPGAASEELIDAVRAEVEPMFEEQTAVSQRRIQDAWKRGAEHVRTVACLPRLLEILEMLYERPPIPFQTLNFKWGTEQDGHSDSIHFSCLPPRYMCGAWLAMEDTDQDNGPLFYYPGSHRLPEVTAYDLGYTVHDPRYDRYAVFQRTLMKDLGFEKVEFHAKRGDILIWSSNIVHGGLPVIDQSRTRWSQVTHYYFPGCVYYAPVLSDMAAGEFLLKDVIDIRTEKPVAHGYDDLEVVARKSLNGRHRISIRRPGHDTTVPGTDADVAALTEESAALRHDLDTVGSDLESVRSDLAKVRSELAAARSGGAAERIRAEAAEAEVRALRASASYRIGSVAVAPARRLRRAGNRDRPES
jgi:hypothetical protein